MKPHYAEVYSNQIEDMMNELFQDTVKFTLSRYLKILSRHLGMDADDVRSEIRVAVWRALLTYEPLKGASIKTYTKAVIENRMKTLCTRAYRHKNQHVEYFAHLEDSQ